MEHTAFERLCSNQAGSPHNVFLDKTMNILAQRILNLSVGTSMMFLLAAGPSEILLAQDASQQQLTKEEIFQKSKAAYAALTSYSDEGKSVAVLNGLTITQDFTTRLSRPNLYRIAWQDSYSSPDMPKAKPEVVWSAGNGDFLDMGFGEGAKKQKDQEMALAGATGISGDAAGEIPAAFFNTKWANPFCCLAKGLIQQADERVGDVDCYVFTGESSGNTRTIWIGKQDFFIRQIRNVTTAAGMKAAMERVAKVDPSAPDEPKTELTGSTSVETHSNIVVNQNLVEADFAPTKVSN
jgi:outer membrane lipoprotein-sorting protein